MTTDNWINIIAAILVGGGTLFLGIMAWRTIRQTRSIQERERKDRLLNEIVEWAIDVTKWRPKRIFRDMADITSDLKLQRLMHSHIVEIMENFIEMRGRNKYISDIAIKFDKYLGEAVDNLIEVLESKIELLAEWKSAIADATAKREEANDEQYFQNAEEHEFKIEKLALKVIEMATNTKTRNIM